MRSQGGPLDYNIYFSFQNLLDESIKEQLNGNTKYNMDSLGFGFSVGTEPEKVTDGLIEDFERIQKDTTDFCNIQVGSTITLIFILARNT